MHAVIDSFALKPFVRALTCLSKYGDEVLIHATPHTLSVSATSSSMSAYSRFMWDRQFFMRYEVGTTNKGKGKDREPEPAVDIDGEIEAVTGQLMVKSLLSILKHKTVEKTVEKCELIITHPSSGGAVDDAEAERDSLESTLTVRLHCHHGVIKTHRLLLNEPESLVAPSVPESDEVSHITLPARTIKDMLDHFPASRGSGDPQLVWTFDAMEVLVRSFEMGAESRGKVQLNTELKIGIDEFEAYDIPTPPITIAFHLREFNATIAFADSLALSLAMHFTAATAPLFIDIDGGDGFAVVFVISTTNSGSQFVRAKAPNTRAAISAPANSRKRARDERDSATPSPAGPSGAMPSTPTPREGSVRPGPQRVQPQWAVHRTDAATHARVMATSPRTPAQPGWPAADSRGASPASFRGASPAPPFSMGPPPLPASFSRDNGNMSGHSTELGPTQLPSQGQALRPLFLPSSQDLQPQMSQLQLEAQADLAGMSDADLDALVADDDEDFGFEPDGSFAVLSSQKLSERPLAPTFVAGRTSRLFQSTVVEQRSETDELMEDEMLTPTQSSQGRDDSIKSFRPLFED